MADIERFAKVFVEEINGIDRMQAIIDLDSRLRPHIPTEETAAIGFICGVGCTDSWGFVCGFICLVNTVSPKNDELIKSRYAIDILGERGLEKEDLRAASENTEELKQAVVKIIGKKLNV